MKTQDLNYVERVFRKQWQKKDFDTTLLEEAEANALVHCRLLFRSQIDSTWLTLTPAGECYFHIIKRLVRREHKIKRLTELKEAYVGHLTELRKRIHYGGLHE
jgi:hypothetical protein